MCQCGRKGSVQEACPRAQAVGWLRADIASREILYLAGLDSNPKVLGEGPKMVNSQKWLGSEISRRGHWSIKLSETDFQSATKVRQFSAPFV